MKEDNNKKQAISARGNMDCGDAAPIRPWKEVASRLLSIGLSIVISMVFIALIVLFSAVTAGNIYELRHPIPKGEDDLGAGLVVVLSATMSFVIALVCTAPLFVLFNRFFSKRISKLLGGS